MRPFLSILKLQYLPWTCSDIMITNFSGTDGSLVSFHYSSAGSNISIGWGLWERANKYTIGVEPGRNLPVRAQWLQPRTRETPNRTVISSINRRYRQFLNLRHGWTGDNMRKGPCFSWRRRGKNEGEFFTAPQQDSWLDLGRTFL